MSLEPLEQAVILAAGQGTRLRPLTDDRPKCLVPLHGRALLEWQLSSLREGGVRSITVVGGYMSDQLHAPGVELKVNQAFESTNMVESLWCARGAMEKGALISYGDIVFSSELVERMLTAPHDISVVVDRRWLPYWQRRFERPLDDAESLSVRTDGCIRSIGIKGVPIEDIEGQYIGMIALRPAGVQALWDCTQQMGGRSRTAYMTDLLQHAANGGHSVHAVWTDGGWLEVDSVSDLRLAESLTIPGTRGLEILR
jgi:choline kinase